jgi:hypothetical protein
MLNAGGVRSAARSYTNNQVTGHIDLLAHHAWSHVVPSVQAGVQVRWPGRASRGRLATVGLVVPLNDVAAWEDLQDRVAPQTALEPTP